MAGRVECKLVMEESSEQEGATGTKSEIALLRRQCEEKERGDG